MTIYNLGSINADLFYLLDHLPAAGETLAAKEHTKGLGGKGTNQSVAAALAGSNVVHIGAVGPDGGWAIEQLSQYGVKTGHIAQVETPTGHAIINVDEAGENAIVIWPGANRRQSSKRISEAFVNATSEDILLLQNETSCQLEAAEIAAKLGMRVIYSAAPFSIESTRAVLPMTSLLIVNQVEAEQLSSAMGLAIEKIPVPAILVTKGANGSEYIDLRTQVVTSVSAMPVMAVDTTGAGDTFAGYFAAGLDQGLQIADAMQLASAAAACKVTRRGTAEAIPQRKEVDRLVASAD